MILNNDSIKDLCNRKYQLSTKYFIFYIQVEMQHSIQQKQQFLRIEILEAAYDPEDFIQFMNASSASESPSIQNISLSELKKVVSEYKQEVRKRNYIAEEQKKAQNEQNQNQPLNKSKLSEKTKIEQKSSKIEYDRYGTFDYETKGTVNCIQAQRIIKEDKIQISVPQMETKQVQGYLFGLGAKTEYFYHIKSNLMKGTVKRLSEDFDWLNTTLLKLFPFLLLPELEPVRKDIKDPYLRRQKDIQQYLQHLSEKKMLNYSYIFTDFLTISSQKMQKFKKSYDSMAFGKGVSLLKTCQGFVEIQLSNKSRQLFNSSKQFSKKTGMLHDSLVLALNKMLDSYRTAIADTYSVVDIFAQLHQSFSLLHNKFPNLKKQEYNDTLVSLNNLFLGIGDNVKNIADTVEKYTKDYFRFYNGLDKNLSKLQKFTRDSQAEYIEFKNTLAKKKQRVINDQTKWDIDNREIDVSKLSKEELKKAILPKEVLAENDLKSWYAFNLKNYEYELGTYLRFITKRYQKVFRSMAVQLLSNDKMYLQSITNFISEGRKVQSTIIDQFNK